MVSKILEHKLSYIHHVLRVRKRKDIPYFLGGVDQTVDKYIKQIVLEDGQKITLHDLACMSLEKARIVFPKYDMPLRDNIPTTKIPPQKVFSRIFIPTVLNGERYYVHNTNKSYRDTKKIIYDSFAKTVKKSQASPIDFEVKEINQAWHVAMDEVAFQRWEQLKNRKLETQVVKKIPLPGYDKWSIREKSVENNFTILDGINEGSNEILTTDTLLLSLDSNQLDCAQSFTAPLVELPIDRGLIYATQNNFNKANELGRVSAGSFTEIDYPLFKEADDGSKNNLTAQGSFLLPLVKDGFFCHREATEDNFTNLDGINASSNDLVTTATLLVPRGSNQFNCAQSFPAPLAGLPFNIGLTYATQNNFNEVSELGKENDESIPPINHPVLTEAAYSSENNFLTYPPLVKDMLFYLQDTPVGSIPLLPNIPFLPPNPAESYLETIENNQSPAGSLVSTSPQLTPVNSHIQPIGFFGGGKRNHSTLEGCEQAINKKRGLGH